VVALAYPDASPHNSAAGVHHPLDRDVRFGVVTHLILNATDLAAILLDLRVG
jgi:hypothetical protein